MLPHPRSSCAGLTTRATLTLALAGAGAAVFLFVVFPRITSSRAAERGQHVLAPTAEDAAQPSAGDEFVLDPTEILPPAADSAEVKLAAPTNPTTAAPATSALVAANAEPEAPQLRYLKGTGKGEKVEPGAGRAQQRKERKEREREAAAMGEVPPQRAAAKAAPSNPNRARLETNKGAAGNGKGRPGSREKKDKKEKPTDG